MFTLTLYVVIHPCNQLQIRLIIQGTKNVSKITEIAEIKNNETKITLYKPKPPSKLRPLLLYLALLYATTPDIIYIGTFMTNAKITEVIATPNPRKPKLPDK